MSDYPEICLLPDFREPCKTDTFPHNIYSAIEVQHLVSYLLRRDET